MQQKLQHSLNFGFNNLNLKLITGRTHIENLASIKVLEKIGMDFIGEGIVNAVKQIMAAVKTIFFMT